MNSYRWKLIRSSYICEIAPSARRGSLTAIPQLFCCAGICLGYFTCYASVHLSSSLAWRTPYIVMTAVSAILASSCFLLPQSPRWLLTRGRREDAVRNARRLDFSSVEAEKDLFGPAATIHGTQSRPPAGLKGLTLLFTNRYRSRTTLALFLLGMCQLCGIDGILYYAPTLFAAAGLPASSASFLASGLSAILVLAITLPSMLLLDRLPRRTVTLVGGTVLASCMLLIGTLYASNSVHASTGAGRWIVITLIFVFALSYASTWALVAKLYASEIQPAQTRASANSVAQGLGFFTNWMVAMITPILLAESRFGAYFLYGGLTVGTVVVLGVLMPETRGLSLEGIEEVFVGAGARRRGWEVVSVVKRWVGRSAAAPDDASAGSGESMGKMVGINVVLAEGPSGVALERR